MPRVDILIGWKPPTWPLHVLNTNGVYKSNTNRAYVGNLLRNHTGSWCGGFSMNISCCFIFQVKL